MVDFFRSMMGDLVRRWKSCQGHAWRRRWVGERGSLGSRGLELYALELARIQRCDCAWPRLSAQRLRRQLEKGFRASLAPWGAGPAADMSKAEKRDTSLRRYIVVLLLRGLALPINNSTLEDLSKLAALEARVMARGHVRRMARAAARPRRPQRLGQMLLALGAWTQELNPMYSGSQGTPRPEHDAVSIRPAKPL